MRIVKMKMVAVLLMTTSGCSLLAQLGQGLIRDTTDQQKREQVEPQFGFERWQTETRTNEDQWVRQQSNTADDR